MAQVLPSSASFSSDCALISRYAAARGHAEPAPELNQHTPASGVSSSPDAFFSPRINNEPNVRRVPEIGSVASHTPDGKSKHDAEWQSHGRETVQTPNNAPNATESSPLITRQQNGGGHDNGSEDDMDWWKELETLGAYTLPVFG